MGGDAVGIDRTDRCAARVPRSVERPVRERRRDFVRHRRRDDDGHLRRRTDPDRAQLLVESQDRYIRASFRHVLHRLLSHALPGVNKSIRIFLSSENLKKNKKNTKYLRITSHRIRCRIRSRTYFVHKILHMPRTTSQNYNERVLINLSTSKNFE